MATSFTAFVLAIIFIVLAVMGGTWLIIELAKQFGAC